MEVLGGPDAEALIREFVDEDWRERRVEAAMRIGEVFAHELLRGDTGEPFESIEYAFREHGDQVRGEDDEQPWNPAQPLSGHETRIEVRLAEARYVERRVPFVDLPGSVRRAKAAVDAGDESGWTPVAEGPVFRYVRALREAGEERMIPPDLRLRTLYTVELACGPDRSVMLVEEGLRGRLEDIASKAVASARVHAGVGTPMLPNATLSRMPPAGYVSRAAWRTQQYRPTRTLARLRTLSITCARNAAGLRPRSATVEHGQMTFCGGFPERRSRSTRPNGHLHSPIASGYGLIHPFPTAPPVYEAHGAVEKAWISPAVALSTHLGASSGAGNSVTISAEATEPENLIVVDHSAAALDGCTRRSSTAFRASPTMYPTSLRSHQSSIRFRQNAESPRSTIRTPGHARRSRRTSNDRIAHVWRAASMFLITY